MSSPLETLPPELFTQILSTISLSQTYPRHHHPTFLSLSLVSKTCRSYCTPYIFTRLFFRESCLEDSETGVAKCIATLDGMGVLGFVEGIDVAVLMAKGNCEWGYEREKVVKLLEKFPNLRRLHIRTGEVLTKEVVSEVQQILVHRRQSGAEPSNHYWWWYSARDQTELWKSQDGKATSMSRCRIIRLFGCKNRRLPPIFPDRDIQHRRIVQHISSSSRLTYLFLLG
jgi:hypothetical protein